MQLDVNDWKPLHDIAIRCDCEPRKVIGCERGCKWYDCERQLFKFQWILIVNRKTMRMVILAANIRTSLIVTFGMVLDVKSVLAVIRCDWLWTVATHCSYDKPDVIVDHFRIAGCCELLMDAKTTWMQSYHTRTSEPKLQFLDLDAIFAMGPIEMQTSEPIGLSLVLMVFFRFS